MSIIRTLTTVMDFKTELSGLKVYEQSVERIKGLVMEVGKMFGLYFAVSKIGSYVESVVDAGKQMMILNAQIKQLARPGDDAVAAQEELFQIAQKTGVQYEKIAETYRGFLLDSRDSKVTQKELLTGTENLFKALRVGKASPEVMANVMSRIEQGFRLGHFGPRQFGLLRTTPRLQEFLMDAFGVRTVEQLEALAKAKGGISAEKFIEAISKPNAKLAAEFDKLPQKLSFTFTRIFNELARGAEQVWKLTGGFSTLGKVIWYVFTTAEDLVKKLIDYMGGLESAIQIVGYALTAVLGPLILRSLLTFAFNTGLAVAAWGALALAVVAAGAYIQDFVLWVSGDKRYLTQFEKWFGPFEDIKKQFENVDFLAPIRAIKDLLTGDITGFEVEMTKTAKAAEELAKHIGQIGIDLGLWDQADLDLFLRDFNEFKEMCKSIADWLNEIQTIINGWGAATRAFLGLDKIKPSDNITTQSVLRLRPADAARAGAEARESILNPAPGETSIAGMIGEALDRNFYIGRARPPREDQIQPKEVITPFLDWLKDKTSYLGPGMGTTGQYIWGDPNKAQSGLMAQAPAPINAPITVTPNYNVNVQATPEAQTIADAVQKGINDTLPGLARQLKDSNPLTEKPNQ